MKQKTRPTLLSFDDPIRQESIRILNTYLSDMINLALMTKQAHWNMHGENFIAVHEMLDPFNEKLLQYADTFAERIVQMGGSANGTAEHICQTSSLPAYPTHIHTITDHLSELRARYAAVANAMRQDIDINAADVATMDYLTQALEDLDKYTWFIESHLS